MNSTRYLKSFFIFLLTNISLSHCSPAYSDESPIGPETRTTDTEILSLTRYKPVYFLFGSPDTKVHFSFKAKILRSADLYLAYSQLMMWELFKPSAPMRDINYNPEFFYRIPLSKENMQRWLDVSVIEHESNGVGGAASRSWNRTSLRYHSSMNITKDSRLLWSLKAGIPYIYDGSSSDLAKYRGIWELNLEFSDVMGGFLKPGDVILRFYTGGNSLSNPLRGAQEVTLRVKTRWQQLLLPAMLQVFHGYAESLLDYKQETWALRAGIGF